MDDKHNSNKNSKDDGVASPLEGVAAATAVGFAVASQALEMWFGVMSGVVRASQEMLEPGLKKTAKPAALKPQVKEPVSAAKPVAAVKEEAVGAEKVASKPERILAELPYVPAPDPQKEDAATVSVAAPRKKRSKPAELPDGVETAKIIKLAQNKAGPLQTVNPADTRDANVSDAVESQAAAEIAPSEPAAPPASTEPQSGLMPEDFRAPKRIEQPGKPDDLKLIPGIGPKLEQVLNSLGIWTFAQVAAWQPEEVAWVEDYTGLNGRIGQDDWLGHAGALAAGIKAAS